MIVFKKNGIMEFAVKWMEQEKKIIPSKVSWAQKEKYGIYLVVSDN